MNKLLSKIADIADDDPDGFAFLLLFFLFPMTLAIIGIPCFTIYRVAELFAK